MVTLNKKESKKFIKKMIETEQREATPQEKKIAREIARDAEFFEVHSPQTKPHQMASHSAEVEEPVCESRRNIALGRDKTGDTNIPYAYVCAECCCILEIPCFKEGKCPECGSSNKDILYKLKTHSPQSDGRGLGSVKSGMGSERSKIEDTTYFAWCPDCNDAMTHKIGGMNEENMYYCDGCEETFVMHNVQKFVSLEEVLNVIQKARDSTLYHGIGHWADEDIDGIHEGLDQMEAEIKNLIEEKDE